MFKGHVSSEPVEIDAPIERAWEILADFERYGEWNPFTPSVATDFEIGSPVELYVRMGPWRLKQVERIEAVEPPHLIAWSTTMGHRFLISALREQRLEAVGTGRCRYRHEGRFFGPPHPPRDAVLRRVRAPRLQRRRTRAESSRGDRIGGVTRPAPRRETTLATGGC